MSAPGKKPKAEPFVSTTNACKLCKPLGATLVFKGIEGGVPYLHGSQGCATYMRRYIISHFREPMDIASSSLGEKQAIYGGGPNLKKGLLTVMDKYGAGLIWNWPRWSTYPLPVIPARTWKALPRRCGPWWIKWPCPRPRPWP